MKRIKIEELMSIRKDINFNKRMCKGSAEQVICTKYEKALDEAEQSYSSHKSYLALDSYLQELQKKDRVRTITVDDIVAGAAEADGRINGIVKSAKDGITVTINPNAQDFPKAYKYKPMATIFTIQNVNGSWYVTDIDRDVCGKKEYEFGPLTDDQKERLVKAVLDGRN